jgi:pilus assembly protein Flp/PilA
MTRRLASLHVRTRRAMDRDQGATAVEYGLMIALIAGVILVTVAALGGQINTAFANVSAAIAAAL